MNRREFLIGSGGFVAGGISSVSGYALLTDDNTSSNNGTKPTAGRSNDVTTENAPKIGYGNGPVDIVYWVDFQCPFCSRFSSRQYPKIKDNYISTDDVRLVLKPLTFFGEDSKRAAESMHCLYNLDKELVGDWYKRLHELFNQAGSRNTGWAEYETLSSEVVNLGISESEMLDCLRNESYDEKIRSDQIEGEEVGLEGTPYFMLYNQDSRGNYETISGAQRYEFFASKIDDKL